MVAAEDSSEGLVKVATHKVHKLQDCFAGGGMLGGNFFGKTNVLLGRSGCKNVQNNCPEIEFGVFWQLICRVYKYVTTALDSFRSGPLVHTFHPAKKQSVTISSKVWSILSTLDPNSDNSFHILHVSVIGNVPYGLVRD